MRHWVVLTLLMSPAVSGAPVLPVAPIFPCRQVRFLRRQVLWADLVALCYLFDLASVWEVRGIDPLTQVLCKDIQPSRRPCKANDTVTRVQHDSAEPAMICDPPSHRQQDGHCLADAACLMRGEKL